jgi:hypothetical protein
VPKFSCGAQLLPRKALTGKVTSGREQEKARTEVAVFTE